MAFTNQEVAAWLSSNPGLSDAQIAAAMQQFNVSPDQVSAVTGVPIGEVVARVAETLAPGEGVLLGDTWINPEYSSSGQGIDAVLGDLERIRVTKTPGGIETEIPTGTLMNFYSPTGEFINTARTKEVGNFIDLLKETATELGPIALAALTAGGAGGALGSSLGLTGTAANVAGGALLGGGGAALTGSDVLKGALLGGGGAYVSSLINAGVTDPDLLQQVLDADIAGGMVPEFGTNAAYDAFMQSAMTPEAMAAIESQIANSSVAGMTPEEILSQKNLITDIASGNVIGPQTAEQLGQGFQDYMAEYGYVPSTITDVVSSSPSVTTNQTTVTTPSLSDIANIIKTGAIVGGLVGGANSLADNGSTGFPIVPIPENWKTPTYGQTGNYPALTPIDFGSPELLRGTQWEKYLNPQVAPVAPVVPVGMNYAQMTNALQGGQSLSINDIISGIQSQYGQTPNSTVG